jgi:hypothetical protein
LAKVLACGDLEAAPVVVVAAAAAGAARAATRAATRATAILSSLKKIQKH